MRFICLCFLIASMRPLPGTAQQSASPHQGSVSYNLWLVRSQSITADLIKDAADLTPSERALLWARLAAKWWRIDPERARSWMLKPIESVEVVPNKENAEERRQRLMTARLVLQIVAPLDQKLSNRLVAILSQDAEREAKAEQRPNVEGLIEAAVYLVDSDPKRAAELGAFAFRVGRPTEIARLLWTLRRKDAALADGLYALALATARQTLDENLLSSLSNAVFPESRTLMDFNPTTPVATDNMRKELLKVLLAYLQANPISTENRNSICISIVSFIAPVLMQFERLLPQQAIIVRQSVNQCQAIAPLTDQVLNDATRDQPLNTVDDLLKAGDDAQDIKVRTVYQFRAASLARQQNDFDRALKILDNMSTESREFMGGSWEAYRWDWAAISALRHLKSGDVYGMRLIINAVPTNLQPYAKIAFISDLPTERDKDTDPTLEFLTDARVGLRRSSVPDADKASWYFSLVRLTVKYQPTDATAVLKEAIAALNHADEPEQKSGGHGDRTWLTGSAAFAAPMLEMDEYAVREGVSSISSADTRVQVRLALLRVCLERLRSSTRPPNTRRTTSNSALPN